MFRSAQFRYAIIYVTLTTCALLFLNLFSASKNREILYSSKQATMLEKSRSASYTLSQLPLLNYSTIEDALLYLSDSTTTRLVVTDQTGRILYDNSTETTNNDVYALFPEIIEALDGNDVFTWACQDRFTYAKTAIPIYAYGMIVGCVYMTEYNAQEGFLIFSLQHVILTLTLLLEIVVIVFSFFFAAAYTKRLRKIMTSMRAVRTGNYSDRLNIGGNDELTVLGKEFNDLIARLQASESKRRQFVSDASHELKTPLASIKLLADSILQNEMDEDTQQEFIENIGQEADRLNRMSQKLLTLSKIESQAEVDSKIIYILPTTKKVLRMLQLTAEKSKVRIELIVNKDSSILIPEDDLYQILFNLVENGIKYNTPGGVLRITISQQEDNAVITVQDTGCGIPAESLSHIFERFYRVDKARSRSTGGTGLGLAIVKSIVDRNNGSISVESTMGTGSLFTIKFPVFEMEVMDG